MNGDDKDSEKVKEMKKSLEEVCPKRSVDFLEECAKIFVKYSVSLERIQTMDYL